MCRGIPSTQSQALIVLPLFAKQGFPFLLSSLAVDSVFYLCDTFDSYSLFTCANSSLYLRLSCVTTSFVNFAAFTLFLWYLSDLPFLL